MEANDDSYIPYSYPYGLESVLVKLPALYLVSKALEKSDIGPPLVIILSPDPSPQHLPIIT